MNHHILTHFSTTELIAPIILNNASILEVDKAKHNFTIKCNATGQPLPKFKWYKGDTEIHRGFVHSNLGDSFAMSQLTRNRITLSDSGVYRCVATNGGGSDESIATIQVQG